MSFLTSDLYGPFPVSIGVASNRESGWSFSHQGNLGFSEGNKIILCGRREMPAPLMAGIAGGAVGGAAGGVVGWVAGCVSESVQSRSLLANLDADKTVELDTSGSVLWDDKRRVLKLELADGSWVVLSPATKCFFYNKAAKAKLNDYKNKILQNLKRIYGSRFQEAELVNRRVKWAGRFLLFFILPLAIGLAILAILGFSGVLD